MFCALYAPTSDPKFPKLSVEKAPAETSPAVVADPDLMTRLAGGDRNALSELYERYATLLLALSLGILHNRSDAEEVVQEVFLYAWRRASSYDSSRSSVSSWLVVITRSRSLDRLRSHNRADSMLSRVESQERGTKTLSSEGFCQVLSEQRAARVQQALGRLPPAQRQVLELSYYRGWTQKQVAEETGVPIGTVKTRTFLALKKLRRELSDELPQLM